jgi:hypothetical protein
MTTNGVCAVDRERSLAVRYTIRVVTRHLTVALFLTACIALHAQDSSRTLNFQVSNETVPTGSLAQIKLFLQAPQPLSQGYIRLMFSGDGYPDTPPRVAAATVFSASGDAMAIGGAETFGGSFGFRIYFRSSSAGVGRIPGLPILEFSIPVTAAFSVTLDLANSSFFGPGGNYKATVAPGSVAIGGQLSIQKITPGGETGILPAGSVLPIAGTGFSSATSVQIEGASVASVTVVSPTLINLTLAAATEIMGKHIRVRNAGGAQVDYWGGLGTSFFTFPMSASSSGSCSRPGPSFLNRVFLMLQNPASMPAHVTVTENGKPLVRPVRLEQV